MFLKNLEIFVAMLFFQMIITPCGINITIFEGL